MLTRAGNMSFQLPDDWVDSTEYVFFNKDETASLRISRLNVVPDATPGSLLDDRIERVSALGKTKRISREDLLVDRRPAAWAAVMIEGEGPSKAEGKAQSRARILVVKPDPAHAICAVLIESEPDELPIQEAWSGFLTDLKFHPPNS